MTINTRITNGKLEVTSFKYPAGIPDFSANPLRNPDAAPGRTIMPHGFPFYTIPLEPEPDRVVPRDDPGFPPSVDPEHDGVPERAYTAAVRYVPVITTVESPDMSEAFEAVKDVGKGDDIELLLNTPGGDVNLGNVLIAQLDAIRKGDGATIVTNIVSYAASMGAMMFIIGDKRIMGKDDQILFHEPNTMFGNVQLSYSEIQELADTGTLTQAVHPGTLEFFQSAEGKRQAAELRNVFKFNAPGFKQCRDEMVKVCMDRLKVSEKFVRSKLIVPFKNSIYTGEEALALGIATELDLS